MDFEVVTLDLDDTLWAGAPALERAERTVYQWLGERYPAITARYSPEAIIAHRRALMERHPELRHDYTRARHAALSRLASEFGLDGALADEGMEVFLAVRSEVDPYDDVRPVLGALAGRYRFVALTNGNACVRRAGLGDLFELAVSPAQAGTCKPDPGMFEYVMARTGVSPRALVHVGDEPETDVAGARGAGAAAVWMNREGRPWPGAHPPPDAVIANLHELAGALARLVAGRAVPATGPDIDKS